MELSNGQPHFGYQIEMLWIDLIKDEIPEKRKITLDSNSTTLRSLIYKTEAKYGKVIFTGIEVILNYKFSDMPEEWSVSL